MSKPIRILQCVPGNMGCGGIENFIMNLYRNIDIDKVQFDFLIHGNGKNYFEEEIKQLGGNIYRVPLIKHYTSYNKQMKKFLKENQEQYKTIHIHAMYAMSYFDAKLAKRSGVKNIIVHSHSANTNVIQRKMVQYWLRNKLTKIANYKMACSKESAMWLFSKNCFKKGEYEIIKNAINVDKYQFNEEIRKKVRKELQIEDKLVIGHVGRLSPAKNHSFLLEIEKEILKQEKNAVLLLVGEGEIKQQIEQQAKELGILNQVIFAGSSKRVENYLQAMDLFVFPSLFEGFGLAVLEAQTNGLKCFVADHITKEIKVTELVEFISLEKTPKDWATKILAKKDYQRESKIDVVKQKKYDIMDMTKEMEKFYLRIN